jgi:hypothetical protein
MWKIGPSAAMTPPYDLCVTKVRTLRDKGRDVRRPVVVYNVASVSPTTKSYL